jgi:cytochrome bd-type quinol oxidase subunit 1
VGAAAAAGAGWVLAGEAVVQETLARWQFAFTTVNHFLFVPVTIGLAFLTAMLQTAWYRRKTPEYLRLTRFFGTLLVINVAIGVVTGLVQEFQFGMNWSAYSRLVGNIFGAPLAMEGLAAFFLESTFLGLWLFGWDKLSRRVHLLTIWLVALGSVLSAAFIMAANSWMQHPVGYAMVNGKPVLNNVWALFTNPVFVWGYTKVVLAAIVTGACVMLAVSAWQLRHGASRDVFAVSARLSLAVLVPAVLLTMLVGDELGVIEAQYQPMKIAAAEAQWTTCQPCSFSLFQIGGGNNDQTPTEIIAIPHLLSLLATNHWNGKVVGLNPLQQQYSKQYGPGYYVPNVFIQYWGMRVMAYLALIVTLVGLWGILLARRKRLATSRVFLWCATWLVVLPFLMNTAGWLLTESGRQPWIVQGIMLTKNGLSTSVSTTYLWTSLIVFALLYGTLGTIDLILMLRYSRKQLEPEPAPADAGQPIPAMQY